MEIFQDGAIVVCSVKAEYNDAFVENVRINENRLINAILIKIGLPEWYDLRFQYSSRFKLPKFREGLISQGLYENISLQELVWEG